MEINAGCSNHSRGCQQSGRDMPAAWSQSVNPRVSFFLRHHAHIFTFTHSRNIYSYIFLISTFGRNNSVGRDSVRHQVKACSCDNYGSKHKSHTNSSVLLLSLTYLLQGCFRQTICVVSCVVYYSLRQGRLCVFVCLFVYLLEK